MKNRNWHEQALCAAHPDPDLWHYENSTIEDERKLTTLRAVEAIEICNECPVKQQCLAQGMETENILASFAGSGTIWGGLMNGERAILAGYSMTHNTYKHETRQRRDIRAITGRIKQ